MSDDVLPEVPTIVVGFRRLEALRRTLSAVIESHEGPIYVFLDAPRRDSKSDADECADVLRFVEDQAHACARLKIRRPEHNLGVARAMPAAIDWVIEEGGDSFILLEEDCLPSRDFYPFMRAMLAQYEHDPRVMMVSGNQFLPRSVSRRRSDSYYFSRFIHIWGWGSWARAWQKYDHNMSELEDANFRANLRTLFPSASEYRFYKRIWFRQLSNSSDTAWASRWLFAMLKSRGLCICPSQNLVRNIGFGSGSTHTKRASRYHDARHEDLRYPLRHPVGVIEWRAADRWWFSHLISKSPAARIRRYMPSMKRSPR